GVARRRPRGDNECRTIRPLRAGAFGPRRAAGQPCRLHPCRADRARPRSPAELAFLRKTMRSTRTVHVISAHAEGEVGDVIVGGVLPPPGDTIWDQSRWIARDGSLRNFVLNEPRGGVF